MSCQPAPSGPEPRTVAHTYTGTNAPILNPERGFFTPYELPGFPGFSPVRATGNTLVHLNIRLDDWRETDLPQAVLDDFATNFADIRDAGLKAIIRFAYNQGPYPDSEPDASKLQILRHIEQLTPLLQENADVIAWVEAGFIGAWGEWHTSTNGLDNLPDKKEILFALLKALPETRMVQVRYPANIIEMFPDPLEAVKARVAHHNDCFLSSDTDVGTYERDGVNTLERDQTYLAELTRFTPMSGETCSPYPPRSECASAIQEMELLHFSAINDAYHKGILRSWDEGGCMGEVAKRLGYRFALVDAAFNERVRPGGTIDLRVDIDNLGFASVINQRPLIVVLDGEERYVVPLNIDVRQWEPGTVTLAAKLHVPSGAKNGEYRLALWLPDGAETLRDNPFYAIQFANENVWQESTGLNELGTITVDRNAGGGYQSGKKMEVMESSALVQRGVLQVLPAATISNVPSSEDSLISNVEISNDEETLFLSFDYTSGQYNAFQLFVDSDQDPGTGYRINGIGADALFENHTWNVYDGSGGDWKWQPTEVLNSFEDSGSRAVWSISRKLLDTVSFDVVAQLVDANWNAVSSTAKVTYTIK